MGPVDELVPGITSCVDDGLVAPENPVGEPVCSEELPDVLHWVQLRRSRWQQDDGKVFRHLEIIGFVPAGTVHQHHRMGPSGNVFADLVEMQLHGVGIGPGEHQGGPGSPLRTDGTEQIGILVALVG